LSQAHKLSLSNETQDISIRHQASHGMVAARPDAVIRASQRDLVESQV